MLWIVNFIRTHAFYLIILFSITTRNVQLFCFLSISFLSINILIKRYIKNTIWLSLFGFGFGFGFASIVVVDVLNSVNCSFVVFHSLNNFCWFAHRTSSRPRLRCWCAAENYFFLSYGFLGDTHLTFCATYSALIEYTKIYSHLIWFCLKIIVIVQVDGRFDCGVVPRIGYHRKTFEGIKTKFTLQTAQFELGIQFVLHKIRNNARFLVALKTFKTKTWRHQININWMAEIE